MRKLVLFLVAMSIAGSAAAKSMDWHGTMVVEIGALDSIALGGSGVSTVNDSSGGSHLSTLRLAGGITDSGNVPVTDPNSTGQIKSIIISGTLGTETLTGISGAPPMGRNELPLKGSRASASSRPIAARTCRSTTRRTTATRPSASAVC